MIKENYIYVGIDLHKGKRSIANTLTTISRFCGLL